MYAVIGTWRMSLGGVASAAALLAAGGDAGDAAETAIRAVEDDPAFTSVGYGGLPALDGRVRLDAGWMDGGTLRVGAVISAEGIASPVRAARLLCGRETNCVLCGSGAEAFAASAGLPVREMLTPAAEQRWREALRDFRPGDPLTAYRGHDTVCVLSLDRAGHMIAGTSTSGLFLKEEGRVGDSPMPGNGFYCDARAGAAAATGLGEDIMRACLSYEAVAEMRRGADPQTAAERALAMLTERKAALGEEPGSVSLITLSPDGRTGAATTLPVFPYAVGGPGGVRLMAVSAGGAPREAPEDSLAGEP